MLRYAEPAVPLFGYLAEHSAHIYGEIGWPREEGLEFARNIATRYTQLGGEIQYRKKVVKILTEHDRTCGVELEDGTQHTADLVVSNADGRKTIQELLDGRYMNKNVNISICSSMGLMTAWRRLVRGLSRLNFTGSQPIFPENIMTLPPIRQEEQDC